MPASATALGVTWVKRPCGDGGEQRAVEDAVRSILDAVRERGEDGVREQSRRLDGWDPPRFRVERRAIEDAYAAVSAADRRELEFARDQVEAFARAQLAALRPLQVEPHPGVVLGHDLIPVDSVGCYVPGGHYPLVAAVMMQVTTARVAGVRRVIACAPPNGDAGIWPATLVALEECGADEIYCLGGAQALAAMAYGTSEIEPVDMITGPGNPYVAEAKRQLFGVVGIDLLAGPTEILIIADAHADPALVACDLLGQAEHGPTSPAHLVTDSHELAEAVLAEIPLQLAALPTRRVAAAAWERLGAIAVVDGPEEMIRYADDFAPEHLEVLTRDPETYRGRLRHYGSLFLGAETTVAFGDKAVGVNHTLPTQRAARYTGGLWVGKFIKVVTYQRLTAQGSRAIAPHAARISALEGMAAHAATCQRRIDTTGDA